MILRYLIYNYLPHLVQNFAVVTHIYLPPLVHDFAVVVFDVITHCVVSDALRPVGAGPVEGQGVGGFGEHPYIHGRGWFRGAGRAEGLE